MPSISQIFKDLYQSTGINLSIFYDAYDRRIFLRGMLVSVEIAVTCVLISVAIGILGGWLRTSRIALIRWVVGGYVHFFRNTPALAQLYFFYFGIGVLMPRIAAAGGGQQPLIDNYQWTIIALSLFGGAFNTELFRAGIEAVPTATIEAAEALGYSRFKTYIYVVLPLAFRISLPALNNNLVTLVKGTTIGYAIGVPELITASSTIWGADGNIPEMMNILMLTFLALVSLLVVGMSYFERKMRIPGYNW